MAKRKLTPIRINSSVNYLIDGFFIKWSRWEMARRAKILPENEHEHALYFACFSSYQFSRIAEFKREINETTAFPSRGAMRFSAIDMSPDLDPQADVCMEFTSLEFRPLPRFGGFQKDTEHYKWLHQFIKHTFDVWNEASHMRHMLKSFLASMEYWEHARYHFLGLPLLFRLQGETPPTDIDQVLVAPNVWPNKMTKEFLADFNGLLTRLMLFTGGEEMPTVDNPWSSNHLQLKWASTFRAIGTDGPMYELMTA